MQRARLALAVASLLVGAGLRAAPVDGVPTELREWIPWALHGHERELCPRVPGENEARCAWPGRLDLDLTDRGGRFTQTWRLHVDELVPLPGEPGTWPVDVRADGRPAAVVVSGGLPAIWLPAGDHDLEGVFEWGALPQSLRIPGATGLVGLRLRGEAVAMPRRDEGERLWLAAREGALPQEDSLQLAVHRRIIDDVPLLVTTRLLLEVGGSAREIQLGPVLPLEAIPVALDSPLPARLEADGRLRVQVRAGSWMMTVTSRQPGPVASLAPADADPWAVDEVWSFEARPDLRFVTVEGVPALDPSQTAIPTEWKHLPTFRVARGDVMRLVERRRGDAEPAADSLVVQRTLWLDFDGGGMTLQDRLSGTLRRSWRLEMGEPYELGAVRVAGGAQLVTRRDASGPSGFETRQGNVSAVAEARIEGPHRALPATAWDADLDGLSVALELPPGWRLAHASGADRAVGSWLDRWTLLDLFLALVVAAAAARIWGLAAGGLALATLVLTIPEGGAPRWMWLVLLSCAAIEKLLAERRARRFLTAARLVAAGTLVVMAVPFLVQQARQALHPQLEQPSGIWTGEVPARRADLDFDRGASAPAAPPMPGERWSAEDNAAPMKRKISLEEVFQREIHDPRDMVQVGPGVPAWTWRRHDLVWSGPVVRDQRLGLVLLPPLVVRCLSAVTIALLALLLLRALIPPHLRPSDVLRRRVPREPPPADPSAPSVATVAGALIGCAMLVASGSARAETPPAEVLQELRARLLEPPPCVSQGDCASIPRMFVEAEPEMLRLRLEVRSAAVTAVALPGSASQWVPSRALVDGRPAAGLQRSSDGILWLLVEAGVHDVELVGPLPAADTVGLSLPERPARVEVRAEGWVVAGLSDGVPGETLQLSRLRREDEGPRRADLAAAALPPFVRVTRRIQIGLTWQASTTVATLVPTTSPVVLRVPLLPGESVTTDGVPVEDGHVLVNLAPGMPTLSWSSALAETDELELVAPGTTAWTEEWALEATPRWHVEWEGVPPVHALRPEPIRVPAWRPWPGERLALSISRPEAAPGATIVFTASSLSLSPGGRVTDAALSLTFTSSRGGDQSIILPEGATASSVALDGTPQPVRQQGRFLALPVLPGAHRVEVAWREPRGMTTVTRSSAVDLGTASVNATVSLSVPVDRWVLWAWGPRLGPAVLFWPLLVVLVILGLGLSRLRDIPLALHDWVLLLVGLSQAPLIAGAAVVLWLLVLAWRRRRAPAAPAALFDLAQILIVIGAVVSVGVLLAAINQGLLGSPDMQIQGNGSSGGLLQWFGDRAASLLPRAGVLSVPLLVYRIAMLLWALWLAAALVRWMRWAWDCFTEGGAWRRPWPRRSRRAPATAATAPAATPTPES